jgi:hypothetical protein
MLSMNNTFIESMKYKELKGRGSNYAKKILMIIRSHNIIYPMYLERWKEMLGSRNNAYNFKYYLICGLKILVEKNDIFAFAITKNNKLYIYREKREYESPNNYILESMQKDNLKSSEITTKETIHCLNESWL